MTIRDINPCKVDAPIIFSLIGRYCKNDGGKAGQHWELKLALIVPSEENLILYGCMCICYIAEDFEF